MKMSPQRITVVVNGKTYQVEVADLDSDPITVRVDGEPYVVRIDGADVQHAHLQTEIPAVLPSVPAPRAAPPVATVAVHSAAQCVVAPMPGSISDIAVKPGDRVAQAQQLCTLEAMKMKSAIRSPRDGVIARVDVSEGRTVKYGESLFAFE